jgi:hypothetical protein
MTLLSKDPPTQFRQLDIGCFIAAFRFNQSLIQKEEE